MKLSQAIRRGARNGMQVFDKYINSRGGSCALGAAMYGSGIVSEAGIEFDAVLSMGKLENTFPELLGYAQCPSCDHTVICPLTDLLPHLNDFHRFSRERIAGWIEAHVETPVYSMLDMQHYMENPEEVLCQKIS